MARVESREERVWVLVVRALGWSLLSLTEAGEVTDWEELLWPVMSVSPESVDLRL